MINQITIVGSRKYATPVLNREALMALRGSQQNLEMLDKARQGDAEAKHKLLQLAYNMGHVQGLVAGCNSIGSYFFHDVDCYDAEQSEAYKEQILAKKDEIGLMMLERSASGGWHLVCRRVPGTTILENQVRVACALKIEMDTGAKDLQRVVFSTSDSSEDLVYLDDALFDEPMSPEECVKEYGRLKVRVMQKKEQLPASARKANKHYRPWEESGIGHEVAHGDSPSVTSQATSQQGQSPSAQSPSAPANERTRFIAEGVMKEKGLEASDFIDEGGRHTTVKIFLSGATQLLKKEETNGVLKELMPDHWQDANIQQLVNDFYQNYTNPSQRLTRYQEDLFTQSRRLQAVPMIPQSLMYQPEPPQMPTALPKLVALMVSKTPEIYMQAVACAIFPPLATHLCDVTFNYTDNREHEATLMNCLMAKTGSGKGCIDEPINRIMADIKRRDAENARREEQWKRDCMKKGANKDKQLRPEGLVIQMIDPDMTKPALVTRMDESEGHFVYVKLNEIDLFEQLKGQTGKQHFQLMCLAFDPGAEYGQTRIGLQSVTARPRCRFNWNACTTIKKGRKFFSKVLTDGPVSRINFSTIPEQEIGAPQPVFGKYDAEFDKALQPYIDHLCNTHGLIDCPQAFELAKKLQEECADFARLSQDEVYWELSHRACIIAWLKACVLYVANGCQWEDTIEDFIRWSLQYDLWCKMQFFGADIEAAENVDERIGKRGPQNLLELLPNEFSLDDAKRLRQRLGKNVAKTQKMLNNWKSRGYVTQISDISFNKLKYRNDE